LDQGSAAHHAARAARCAASGERYHLPVFFRQLAKSVSVCGSVATRLAVAMILLVTIAVTAVGWLSYRSLEQALAG
jgi:hypothetical protein